MNLTADIELGDGLRIRTLTEEDCALVVEATRAETGRSMWGPYPVGPYASQDALGALREWDPAGGRQASYGIVEQGYGNDRLLGVLGLMLDATPHSAELAYWVRPESRRQGLALRGIRALTSWAHDEADLSRIWLEIDPANAASQRLADRADYVYEERLSNHCRMWISEDPERDSWHDCLIWAHTSHS